jgi:uncharacterized membrane protein YhaH (DUF805 family)
MRILSDRSFLRFSILAVLFLMIAGIMATQPGFVVKEPGHRARVVTRPNHPIVFWSVDAAVIALAIGSAALAVRRARKIGKESPNSDQRPANSIALAMRKFALAWFMFVCVIIVILHFFPGRSRSKPPNQAAQSTTPSVTPPAGQEARQP